MDLKGKTVLVVDDEKDISELYQEEFSSAGCKVLAANSGNEAYKIFENEKVDIVVSDIRMPDGTGIDLLQKIKKKNPDTPVVLLVSGYSDHLPEDIFHMGAEAIFSKPCDMGSILRTAGRAIQPADEKWRLNREVLEGEMVLEFKLESLSSSISASVLNIGRGGMFISTKQGFPKVGEKVWFKIHFTKPDFEESFSGVGICRWVRAAALGKNPSGFGLEFEALSKTSLTVLYKILNNLKTTAFIPKA